MVAGVKMKKVELFLNAGISQIFLNLLPWCIVLNNTFLWTKTNHPPQLGVHVYQLEPTTAV